MVLGAIGTIGKCQHLTYATGLVGVACSLKTPHCPTSWFPCHPFSALIGVTLGTL